MTANLSSRCCTAATPVARSATVDSQTVGSADSDVRGRPIGVAEQGFRAGGLDASTTESDRSEGPIDVLHRAWRSHLFCQRHWSTRMQYWRRTAGWFSLVNTVTVRTRRPYT